MNDDPSNIDTDVEPVSNENQNSPSEVAASSVQRKRSKKPLLLALSAMVVVILGGYYASTLTTPKKANRDYGHAQKIPQFYLASDTTSVRSFDPATKRLSSETIQAAEDEKFRGRSASTNQFLQMSPDGNTTAYLTDKYNQVSPPVGDGIVGSNGHILYASRGGAGAKQIMEAEQVSDWVLSTDGSMIYYLTQNDADQGQDFHVLGLDNGKDILVEKNIFGDSVGKKETPMLVANDGSVRIYITYESGIREYRYEDTFVTSKRLTTNECNGCTVAFGSPLSPNGKSLVLRGIEQTGEVSLNILDIASGTIKQIKRTAKMLEQFSDVYWAPDGTALVYSVGPYGNEAQRTVGFSNRFEMYNLKTKAISTGFTDRSPGVDSPEYAAHSVGVLGWSPDGSFIMFYSGGRVKMYTLSSKVVADTGLPYEWWKGTPYASGWYTIWKVTQKIK